VIPDGENYISFGDWRDIQFTSIQVLGTDVAALTSTATTCAFNSREELPNAYVQCLLQIPTWSHELLPMASGAHQWYGQPTQYPSRNI